MIKRTELLGRELSSCANMSNATTSFKDFPRFPEEIRRLIWHFSMLAEINPRILPLYIFKFTCAISLLPEPTIRSFSPLPRPKFLHVCKYTRQETLRVFRRGPWDNVRESNALWNPSMDIIHIPHWLPLKTRYYETGVATVLSLKDSFIQEQMREIQHLACSTRSTSIYKEWSYSRQLPGPPWSWLQMAEWLSRFPDLKTFTLTVDFSLNHLHSQPSEWIDYPNIPIDGPWQTLDVKRRAFTPQKIKWDFEKCFEIIKYAKSHTNWTPPQLRIVLNKQDLRECWLQESLYRNPALDNYDNNENSWI